MAPPAAASNQFHRQIFIDSLVSSHHGPAIPEIFLIITIIIIIMIIIIVDLLVEDMTRCR